MNILSNKYLTIETKNQGAELTSIRSNKSENEYLWQADPKYWARHSPVLFPIVGKVWQEKYKYNNKEYVMSQHGFARDMDFELINKSNSEIYYKLSNNAETFEKYPFEFELIIGYKIYDNKIDVIWEVKNIGSKEMNFQIGAHPAFNLKDFDSENKINGYFYFGAAKDITYKLIGEMGCLAVEPSYPLELENNLMPLNKNSFEKDALVIEDSQISEVSILDRNKQPYIALYFDAPVVGLWSPPAKNAPFVCIEPWYGRCDREHFTDDFSKKDWINHLAAGETFKTKYTIEVK